MQKLETETTIEYPPQSTRLEASLLENSEKFHINNLEEARNKVIEALAVSEPVKKELKLTLAGFELSHYDLNQGKEKEIIDTYGHLQRLVNDTNDAGLPQFVRRRIALALAKNLEDPWNIDQAEFGLCGYSGVQRLVYKRHPALAAKLVADAATQIRYNTVDDLPVLLDKGDLWTSNAEQRSPDDRVFQAVAQNLTLQHGPKTLADIFGVSRKNLRYISGPAGEKVIDVTGQKVLDAVESNLLLRRQAPGFVQAYQQITGEFTDPVYLSGSETDVIENDELRPLMYISDQKQLRRTLVNLQQGGFLPIILGVDSDKEPFLTDKEGVRTDGRHAVVLTAFDTERDEASVDNSWGKNKDHSGKLPDEKARIKLDDLFQALKSHGEPSK